MEELVVNAPIYIESRIDERSGEERILELGPAKAGRVLFIAWTVRGEFTRPVTAFAANRKTRTSYQRKCNEEKQ